MYALIGITEAVIYDSEIHNMATCKQVRKTNDSLNEVIFNLKLDLAEAKNKEIDFSQCIRNDFGIDTTKKVMFYQVSIQRVNK